MNKADLVREWFEYAANDLRAAAHMFENMHPKPLEIVCYHCQQCVEKALKGYLINHLDKPMFKHLRDPEKFKDVTAVGGTPTWISAKSGKRDLDLGISWIINHGVDVTDDY